MLPVTMPMLGLTMEEGTVAEWLKHEGDSVRKEEPLLTVEMDKGTVEVPAPASGVLRRILVQPGTTVRIKTPIAEIEAEGNATRVAVAPASAMAPAPAEHARIFASPRARMRARELGVDLAAISGSGPSGRIIEADVLGARPEQSRLLATPLARRLASAQGVDIRTVQGTGPGGRVTQEDVARTAQPQAAPAGAEPLSRLRRITADRMAASARATARVTLFLEADFSEAARFRRQLQPEFARLGVPKLPWDALLARATALALVEHPALAAQWVEGGGLQRNSGVHIGIAVALEPEGLVVPVLRDADQRTLRELAAALLELSERAHAGRLSPHDMQGGTLSITNLGGYRIDGFTPIVNPPETAILGVGRIADKAVVIDGRIEARTMCTLSLSFDHRVVDGAPAAAYLARVAELIERPYALLGI